ncbi:DOPA 4,5-dioxygenase family protein [Neptunomonas qingdaonensis]|uniref:DOPA 4,5-dioxygenase n=1 Tax=Neptunomonas qingdaonensis TaxID=1045558 RepID=A0A1I2W486_9GAMM|nr:DOPA 4,5-dioxygenase family protein [Neptunomonas qingdaonensis]SFG96258.1 DOPA 4,5-dioxygenase [Neptunomonas qingdaonensis]
MAQQSATISAYHAHVYFAAGSLNQAVSLCENARDNLPVAMGRVHQKRVGPHPEWSCQLSFSANHIGEVLPWLILNRNGLTVFLHPVTGNDLDDHTKYITWLGDSKPLNIKMFLKKK